MHLEVDRLKNLVRGVQFQEEHDEDPMVGHLVFHATNDFGSQ